MKAIGLLLISAGCIVAVAVIANVVHAGCIVPAGMFVGVGYMCIKWRYEP